MHSDEFCALLWLVASAHLRLALGQHMGLAFYKVVQKHSDLAGLASYAVPFTLVSPFCLQACHYSQQHAKAMATCLLIFAFYCKL